MYKKQFAACESKGSTFKFKFRDELGFLTMDNLSTYVTATGSCSFMKLLKCFVMYVSS